MNQSTDLSRRMMARAATDGLASDHPIRTTALAFDAACALLESSEQTDEELTKHAKRMLGCWARARRAWRDYSGEAQL